MLEHPNIQNLNIPLIDDLTLLQLAARHGYLDVINNLLQRPGIAIDYSDKANATALVYATIHGHTQW